MTERNVAIVAAVAAGEDRNKLAVQFGIKRAALDQVVAKARWREVAPAFVRPKVTPLIESELDGRSRPRATIKAPTRKIKAKAAGQPPSGFEDLWQRFTKISPKL